MRGSVVWGALLVACSSPTSQGDSDGTSDGTSEGSDEGDASEDTGSVPQLIGEPLVTRYPSQPMVVDVDVEFDAPAELQLAHDSDAGVRVETTAVTDEGRQHQFRIRGLAPELAHSLTLSVVGGEPLAVEFTTLGPLPGFRPNFEVDDTGAGAETDVYRLFDYGYMPLFTPTGVFAVDAAGVTRWYLGGAPATVGATGIWTGLTLRADGTLLTAVDGAILIVDELGQTVLRFAANEQGLADFHHDAIELANGNLLTLSNSFADVDYEGEGTVFVAGDLLVEFDPSGEVVWTWDAFDHLDPQRRLAAPGDGLAYKDPETGMYGYDWTHGNALVEGPGELILVSMRHQDWIVAIDHTSGEVAWRLGEDGEFALTEGTWFHHQHSPQWQPDGSLLVYDNGLAPGVPLEDTLARAVRYELDLRSMVAAQVWQDDGEPIVSTVAGDVDLMPGANVLVLDSALQPDPAVVQFALNTSRIRELDPTQSPMEVWSLTTQEGKYVFRAVPTTRLPGESP